MKTLTTISLALAVAAAGAQTTSQSQIRHIETSLNHLTVLEFGESVATLAIADPDVVDHGIEAAEVVCLISDAAHCRDG